MLTHVVRACTDSTRTITRVSPRGCTSEQRVVELRDPVGLPYGFCPQIVSDKSSFHWVNNTPEIILFGRVLGKGVHAFMLQLVCPFSPPDRVLSVQRVVVRNVQRTPSAM